MTWGESIVYGAKAVKKAAVEAIKGNSTTPENVGLYQSCLKNKGGKALLIIDPQNDFHMGGSLAVLGSSRDALRISQLIRRGNFDEIYVTLDTHNKYHIAHSSFWCDENGRQPKPFAVITSQDLAERKWMTANEEHEEWAKHYVKELEKNQKFTLMVWPDHCLIGSKGHAIQDNIWKALKEWENRCGSPRAVHYIIKGTNALTEHYSALKAEVPVPNFPETKLNETFLNQLKSHEKVFVCGQALSHCVNFTVRDMVGNWDESKLGNIHVVTDAASSVEHCEKMGEDFLAFLKQRKVALTKTEDVLKEVRQVIKESVQASQVKPRNA